MDAHFKWKVFHRKSHIVSFCSIYVQSESRLPVYAKSYQSQYICVHVKPLAIGYVIEQITRKNDLH